MENFIETGNFEINVEKNISGNIVLNILDTNTLQNKFIILTPAKAEKLVKIIEKI
jgi:hypothetical protein